MEPSISENPGWPRDPLLPQEGCGPENTPPQPSALLNCSPCSAPDRQGETPENKGRGKTDAELAGHSWGQRFTRRLAVLHWSHQKHFFSFW